MSWSVPCTRLLTHEEIRTVLFDLEARSKRSVMSRRSLAVFRLACCCGLRASELTRIRLSDVKLVGRPFVDIRSCIGKGKKAREVPLWWDAGTLADLTLWKEWRLAMGAGESDYFLVTGRGKPLTRQAARCSFQSACRKLGRPVTIHDGRHSFISHALDRGRSLVEVKEAAGHSSLGTTSIYAHLVTLATEGVGDMFA